MSLLNYYKLCDDNENGELYFHILRSDRCLSYGDNREVVPGREMKARRVTSHREGVFDGNPILCSYGMHASINIQDAVKYKRLESGVWICLVRLNTKVVHGNDKSVALRRKVVAMRQLKRGDLKRIIHAGEFNTTASYNCLFIRWITENPWTPSND